MNQIKWFFMSKYKKLLYQIKCAETNEQSLILQNGVVLDFSRRTAALDKLYETISRAGYSSYARTLISKKWHENNNKRIQGLEAEIERLEEENRRMKKYYFTHDYHECHNEAIKEFDKKFKRASDLICTGSSGSGAADIKNYYRISFDSYEKLIQEMTEKAAHDE